jgi:MFS family permease
MPLLSGPIMAHFVEKYGCRKMTAVGGAISCFGFILSSLCNSVEGLYLTIGIIGGLGLSAAYIVGLVTVERWFKTHRSLAIGIVSAGTGFGTFVLPPITQCFLNVFEWKLTIICLSGFLMIMPIVAVFLDDPPWKIKEAIVNRQRKLDYISIKTSADEEKEIRTIHTAKCASFVDFSHFRDRNFALLSLSSFAIYTLYNTAFYFLPELLKGTDLDSATYIACIGFFLMLGMVFLGWCADQKSINIVILNSGCVLGNKTSSISHFCSKSFNIF